MNSYRALFSPPMALACIDGTKCLTRRIVKLPHENPLGEWQPIETGGPNGGRLASGQTIPLQGGIWHTRTGDSLLCPFGMPGDLIYGAEAWRSTTDLDPYSGSRIAEMCLDAGYRKPWAPIQYEADGRRVNWERTGTPPHSGPPVPGRYRHARFMPKWATRIHLVVANVRVERLQDISEADAIAEGIKKTKSGYWSLYGQAPADGTYSPRASFRALWESLHGHGSWGLNPWVWRIAFNRRTSDIPLQIEAKK